MKLYETIKYAGMLWMVVDEDSENNTICLLSKDIITQTAYDSKYNEFETSDISKLLNGDFYQKLIKRGAHKYDIVGDITLLSTQEYQKLVEDGISFQGMGDWWLNTPCFLNTNYAALIDNTGNVFDECVIYSHGVRPLLWIHYDALSEKQQEKLKDPPPPIEPTPEIEIPTQPEPVPEPEQEPIILPEPNPEPVIEPIIEEAPPEVVAEEEGQYSILLTQKELASLKALRDMPKLRKAVANQETFDVLQKILQQIFDASAQHMDILDTESDVSQDKLSNAQQIDTEKLDNQE